LRADADSALWHSLSGDRNEAPNQRASLQLGKLKSRIKGWLPEGPLVEAVAPDFMSVAITFTV
jgi:hypothetical protein